MRVKTTLDQRAAFSDWLHTSLQIACWAWKSIITATCCCPVNIQTQTEATSTKAIVSHLGWFSLLTDFIYMNIKKGWERGGNNKPGLKFTLHERAPLINELERMHHLRGHGSNLNYHLNHQLKNFYVLESSFLFPQISNPWHPSTSAKMNNH